MGVAPTYRLWLAQPPSLGKRLTSRRAVVLLARNTAVSSLALVFGLAVLCGLVEVLGSDQVLAAGVSFLAATSLHYIVGREWIFGGTARGVAAGYGYFVIIAGVGLVLTMLMFAAIIRWTPLNYLVARILVSIVAGVAMFALNALLNFKRL